MQIIHMLPLYRMVAESGWFVNLQNWDKRPYHGFTRGVNRSKMAYEISNFWDLEISGISSDL